jgi:hypothetical protein
VNGSDTLFYLGSHIVPFLKQTDVPLFVSARRLRQYTHKGLPKALGRWACDSGGFSELQLFGEWRTSPEQYADEVVAWSELIGGMDWAAIQDWMCEPIVIAGGKAGPVIFAGTKLSVKEHQRRTIESYFKLTELAPSVRWKPVLQGFEPAEYFDHLKQWREAGYHGKDFGVGSICRRQGTDEVRWLLRDLASEGLALHGFGLKADGLPDLMGLLDSADSLAWSFNARKNKPLPGCTHKNCNSCLKFALQWRERLLKNALFQPSLNFWRFAA